MSQDGKSPQEDDESTRQSQKEHTFLVFTTLTSSEYALNIIYYRIQVVLVIGEGQFISSLYIIITKEY